MRVRIFDTADRAAAAAARVVARRLRVHPKSVLGLPAGRTAAMIYRHLLDQRPDFSSATTFNLDEFVGLPPVDPRSFRSFIDHHLLSRVAQSPRRTHFLDGSAPSPDRECSRYEREIAGAGGLDLIILGIGANGHIGFNEPGDRLAARTHRARLTRSTRSANAELFAGRAAKVPREALTMGMGTILGARAIVLVATGRSKAEAVRRLLHGPITTRLPASFLQLHPAAELILDRAAAPPAWSREA